MAGHHTKFITASSETSILTLTWDMDGTIQHHSPQLIRWQDVCIYYSNPSPHRHLRTDETDLLNVWSCSACFVSRCDYRHAVVLFLTRMRYHYGAVKRNVPTCEPEMKICSTWSAFHRSRHMWSTIRKKTFSILDQLETPCRVEHVQLGARNKTFTWFTCSGAGSSIHHDGLWLQHSSRCSSYRPVEFPKSS